MFSQYYGNYLLNSNIITAEQLLEALQKKSETRMKLGVLAINAGYMTAGQVENVHKQQAVKNMRIGDLAVAMGYMTNEQVEELLNSQKPGYLLLGQTLVDLGYLTNAAFEETINAYKAKYSITDADMTTATQSTSNSMAETLLETVTDDKTKHLYSVYISLLINDFVRFVGADFTILSADIKDIPKDAVYYSSQDITDNDVKLFGTTIAANDKALLEFATRYAEEPVTEIDEYAYASFCDFINLQNGLYTVNLSNEEGLEYKLTPPVYNDDLDSSSIDSQVCLKFMYPFGDIYYILSK
ncbi:MAG: chemotaxis protein CheX [Lachnospiraceae bacterium]|nr:chemotaxis protein CheX [Lachnospiraceae bacterium]